MWLPDRLLGNRTAATGPLRAALFGAFAAGMSFQLAFGCIGLFRSAPPAYDLHIFVNAGRVIAAGLDPYVVQLHPTEELGRTLAAACCFANPPNAMLFGRLYAAGDFATLSFVVDVLNLLSMAVIAWMCVAMMRRDDTGADAPSPPLTIPLMVALVLFNPFATHALYLGQTSLVTAAAVVGTWFLVYEKPRPLLAGALLAVACLKPTLSILLVVWLLLDRQWRTLVACGMMTALFSLYAVIGYPVRELVTGWLATTSYYATLAPNLPGDINRMGLTSLAATLGLDMPSGLILGIPLTVLLWIVRHRLPGLQALGLVCGLTVLTQRDAQLRCGLARPPGRGARARGLPVGHLARVRPGPASCCSTCRSGCSSRRRSRRSRNGAWC